MSDVLSAEEVYEIEVSLGQKRSAAKARALSDSHEQLRGERDAAMRQQRSAVAATLHWRSQAEAAARAGGCAADLAESLRAIAISPSKHPENLRAIARMALTKFDRAVSGQTAEKEEA